MNYTLTSIIEVAHIYVSGERLYFDTVSCKHNIPPEAFDSIIKKLNETKLITIINGK